MTTPSLAPPGDPVAGSGSADHPLSEEQVRDLAARAPPPPGPAREGGRRGLPHAPPPPPPAPAGRPLGSPNAPAGAKPGGRAVLAGGGTPPPMSDAAINGRLEITAAERAGRYGRVRVLNHAWNDPAALAPVGTLD